MIRTKRRRECGTSSQTLSACSPGSLASLDLIPGLQPRQREFLSDFFAGHIWQAELGGQLQVWTQVYF